MEPNDLDTTSIHSSDRSCAIPGVLDTTSDQSAETYGEDVHTIDLGGRTILLVGTAHISQHSADLVMEVIDKEKPDTVCVELDERRYEALSKRKTWENLDLKEIIQKKQLSTLLVNLVLAAYQKKMGNKLGVLPGAELLAAAQTAEAAGIAVRLCDRDVRVTLRRAWHATSLLKKSYLIATLIASLFEEREMSEEKLAEMRKTDVISELLHELGQELPELVRVLIFERDTYLAEKIKAAPGKKLVAVVGAGHVAGIKKALFEDRTAQMAAISVIPPVSPVWQIVGWSIPALILSSLVYIGMRQGLHAAGQNALFWIIATGTPSLAGALLALAHPLTILGAFASAPLTTLSPLIGVGHVTAFIQVWVRPPFVREFETILDDMATVSGWWRNRLLKVFLAFLLPSLGGMVGMWIGSYEIISNLF